MDQAALTGESLPVSKEMGESVYSGSTLKQGEAEAVVIATGVHSFFGKVGVRMRGGGGPPTWWTLWRRSPSNTHRALPLP